MKVTVSTSFKHFSNLVNTTLKFKHFRGFPAPVRTTNSDILAGLTLLLLVVVSAFDSAPSLANTDVRFKPFQGVKQKLLDKNYCDSWTVAGLIYVLISYDFNTKMVKS